jgi:hypothetical protein
MIFRQRYFEALGLDPGEKDEEEHKKLAAALGRAHELRKFEIELYWKRAAYFWAFQAISFAALGLSIKEGAPRVGVVLLGAAALGALTGFAGWLTAKGSKFWQENWEAHVEMLEEPAGEGRLTQVVICRDTQALSVSRINQMLLGLIALGWLALLVIAACPWLKDSIKGASIAYQATGLLCIVVLVGTAVSFTNRSRLAGRAFTVGGTDWVPYPRPKKARGLLIWRDQVGGRPRNQEPRG